MADSIAHKILKGRIPEQSYWVKKRIDTGPVQLDLFDNEERAAIIEFDGHTCRSMADSIAGVNYLWRSPECYLKDLISDREPLIHLYGNNPLICIIRTMSAYEMQIAKTRAWMSRKLARKILSDDYSHTGKLVTGGVESEIWHIFKRGK